MKKLAFAALLVAGCGNSVTGGTGASACITAAACGIIQAAATVVKVDAEQVNCIATAGSNCDAARRCLNYGMNVEACSGTSASCETSTMWKACDSATGTNGANGSRRFKCSDVPGATCVVGADQFGGALVDCGFGSCSGTATSCVDNNTAVQSCVGGILRKEDCTRSGSTCIPAGAIVPAHCGGTGPGCSSPGIVDNTLRCDGDVVVSCSDSHEARYDCARDNLHCFANPNPNGRPRFGCYLDDKCDPNNYTAVCNGLTLKFCNNGKEWTTDCGKAGFNGCDPSGGGRCTKS
jgi:hypothetical protein